MLETGLFSLFSFSLGRIPFGERTTGRGRVKWVSDMAV